MLCTRAIEEPSILAVCNTEEARALFFPSRMTRQRTLSNVVKIFGILRVVLTNLRNKNLTLKEHQKQISRENDVHTVDKSTGASSGKSLRRISRKRAAIKIFEDDEDNATPKRVCWIKLEGQRRQFVLCGCVYGESLKCFLTDPTHFLLTSRFMRELTTTVNASMCGGGQAISPRPSPRKNTLKVPSPQGVAKKKRTNCNQLQKQAWKRLKLAATPSPGEYQNSDVSSPRVSDLGDDSWSEKVPRVGVKHGSCRVKLEGQRRQCMLLVCRIERAQLPLTNILILTSRSLHKDVSLDKVAVIPGEEDVNTKNCVQTGAKRRQATCAEFCSVDVHPAIS